MIVGIATLIAIIFGGGPVDYFYIDKIEKSINKDVVDKDRKKEINAEIKDFTKQAKEFNKNRKNLLKELRKTNLDINSTADYYVDFFEKRKEERKELQKATIKVRLSVQAKITDEEWQAMMATAAAENTKENEKAARKEVKKEDKNKFRAQETAIVTHVEDAERRAALLEGLAIFEEVYDNLQESYEDINVNQSDFLSDKYVTMEELVLFAALLDDQRTILYKAYATFIIVAKEYATEDEYPKIMKAFNELVV